MAWLRARTAQEASRHAEMLVVLLCVSALSPVLSVPADMSASTGTPHQHDHDAHVHANAQASSTAAPAPRNPQDIPSFFPKIKNDLTKVTWAHAVNSQSLLLQALNSSVMMLEADVLLGTVNGSGTVVPIMGHPPANTSDLSLQDFLRTIVTHNKDHPNDQRGVKLDFKSIEVFEKAMDYMKENFDKPSFPVWLNADILAGPVKATAVPVDPSRFLSKAKEQYPELMLSLGWTTRWGKGLDGEQVPISQGRYSDSAVNDMIHAINNNNITQPITYAVRAAFVAQSLDVLKNLLNKTHDDMGKPTLTVWSSDETDKVDVKMLRKNILELGKSRVYVDVGEKLSKELDLASSAMAAYASLATTITALLVAVFRGWGVAL